MIYSPPWLDIARADARRGVLERAGNAHNPRIIEYHSRTTLHAQTDEVPWCAAAVCCWLEEAGIESTRSARARSFLGWGATLNTPAFGCVAIIKRGRGEQPPATNHTATGHVGLFVDMPTPNEIILLGGNQSDRVCERTYALDRVLGWRWPE